MANFSSFFRYFIYFLVLTTLIVLADWLFLSKPTTGIDDANIFMNYARNLANGDGFVFNKGGERVEGFTSMLWVLICACFYKLFANPELPITIFLTIITAYTITLVYLETGKDIEQLQDKITKKGYLVIYTGFIIAVGPSFITWSVLTLMENALWNLLFVTAVILILRSLRNGGISLAGKVTLLITGILMILTRPEALAWTVIFSVFLIIAGIRNKSGWGFPIIYLLLAAATTFILIRFRLQYFGYPLPNTYYAKVSENKLYNIMNGLEYAYGFVVTYNPVITLLLIALVTLSAFGLLKKQILRNVFSFHEADNSFLIRNLVITVIIVIAILLVCITGGDHFGAFRFYQFIVLLLAWGISALVWGWTQYSNADAKKDLRFYLFSAAGIFIIITGANSLFSIKKTAHTQLKNEFRLAANGRELAEALNACWPGTKPSTGVIAVGGFGLAYKGETVDIMGLNNTLMGHSKGDRIGIKNHAAFNKDVFYQLHPDLLMPATVPDAKAARLHYLQLTEKGNLENQTLKNILTDTTFRNSYTPALITGASGKVNVFGFVNNNALADMERSSYLIIVKIAD